MHELGSSLRTDILRDGVGGPIENLVDAPVYDFDVTFGEETEDEMCFNFVMVYPIDLVGEPRQRELL